MKCIPYLSIKISVNKTWILVHLPPVAFVVDCKWLFKLKKEIERFRYKARLVAKCFYLAKGIGYTKFLHTVKFTTVTQSCLPYLLILFGK